MPSSFDAQLLLLLSLLSFLFHLYLFITMFCCLSSPHQVSEVLVMLIAPSETRALLFTPLAFQSCLDRNAHTVSCPVPSPQPWLGCQLGLQAAVSSLTVFGFSPILFFKDTKFS